MLKHEKEEEEKRIEAISLLERDKDNKKLKELFDLILSKPKFNGYEDPSQLPNCVKFVLGLAKVFTDLGFMNIHKIACDGMIIIKREDNNTKDIIASSKSMNIDRHGDFIIRSGQLANHGLEVNGLGRKIELVKPKYDPEKRVNGFEFG